MHKNNNKKTSLNKKPVFTGIVMESLKGSNFIIDCEIIPASDEKKAKRRNITAFISGKIRDKHIKIMVGDTVDCEIAIDELKFGLEILEKL